jgi:hypothetical protein
VQGPAAALALGLRHGRPRNAPFRLPLNPRAASAHVRVGGSTLPCGSVCTSRSMLWQTASRPIARNTQ